MSAFLKKTSKFLLMFAFTKVTHISYFSDSSQRKNTITSLISGVTPPPIPPRRMSEQPIISDMDLPADISDAAKKRLGLPSDALAVVCKNVILANKNQ